MAEESGKKILGQKDERRWTPAVLLDLSIPDHEIGITYLMLNPSDQHIFALKSFCQSLNE